MSPIVIGALQLALLGGVMLVGPMVVLTRDPRAQALTLTFYGLLLGLLFLVFQAPDVALAQFVVGAVLLPILVLLTLARMRRHDAPDDGKERR
jgi:uncharacterized MnhB-related membrane protein